MIIINCKLSSYFGPFPCEKTSNLHMEVSFHKNQVPRTSPWRPFRTDYWLHFGRVLVSSGVWLINSIIITQYEFAFSITHYLSYYLRLPEKRLNTIPYFSVYGLRMPIYGSNLSQYGNIRDRIQAFFALCETDCSFNWSRVTTWLFWSQALYIVRYWRHSLSKQNNPL